MTKQIWQGPYKSPFKAAVKALDAAGYDTIEFCNNGAWSAVSDYPFFDTPEDFIEDTLAFLAAEWGVVVQLREDGFYAVREEDEKSTYGKVNDLASMCVDVIFTDSNGKEKWVARFLSEDDADLFIRSKQ